MRYYILFLFLQIAFVNVAYSQRPANTEGLEIKSDTLQMDGYTYICDTLMNIGVHLYNAENHPERGEVRYKTGESLNLEEVLTDTFQPLVISDSKHRHLHSIVDNAFSQTQVEYLNEKTFTIVLNISSSDGSITDVYFKYFASSGYSTIPVEVFRDIEVQLKNNIFFELTEEGRKMNYCYLAWSQCPRGRDGGLTMPEDGEKLTLPDGKLGDAVGSLGGSAIRP